MGYDGVAVAVCDSFEVKIITWPNPPTDDSPLKSKAKVTSDIDDPEAAPAHIKTGSLEWTATLYATARTTGYTGASAFELPRGGTQRDDLELEPSGC